eukprot:11195404-Lingulodinium_polyedra.AAC.1
MAAAVRSSSSLATCTFASRCPSSQGKPRKHSRLRSGRGAGRLDHVALEWVWHGGAARNTAHSPAAIDATMGGQT